MIKPQLVRHYGGRTSEIRNTDAAGPVTLDALRSGQSQVVNLFTTSPDIVANRWVELADPQHMYPAQRIVALVRTGALDRTSVNALNAVSNALTTAKLAELNQRLAHERAVPADLAQDFVNSLP